MGRKSKGVKTINEPACLDYSLLVKQGYLLKEQGTSKGTITWCKQGLITEQAVIEATCSPYLGKRYLTLSFCVAEPDGNLIVHRQSIELVELDSNLGKGKITYFKCPVTGRKSRKLYKFENGKLWQCRSAYDERLYYPLQLCSKMNSYQERYLAFNQRLAKVEENRIITRHNGKLTKRFILRSDLAAKKHNMHQLMWSPQSMQLKYRRLISETMDELTSKQYA